MRNVKWLWLLGVASLVLCGSGVMAAGEPTGVSPIVSPWSESATPLVAPVATGPRVTVAGAMAPGDPVNLDAALVAAGNYLRKMQADVTEDNAGNGSGLTESPNDPDDAGWDWSVTSPPAPFFHTTAASPKNIYGVSVLGLYYAYLETNNASYFTAMTDAANKMAADAGIRSSSDLIFLMLYNDLPGVLGTAYRDAAKAKFDARIAAMVPPTATRFAEYIRDVRGVSQGYPNGIIGWDIGTYVVAAQMLEDRYPADAYDYALAADDMAEVLWQDSFNDNPGLFDIVDDAGWDPTWTNVNYWWYTLGVSGLIEAFNASGSHTAELPGLVNLLLESQFTTGAVSGSYGANATDEDWQSTAYAAAALAHVDQVTHQTAINHMAYWAGATQDLSGGWLYSSGTHYPEVAGELAVALFYGYPPDYCLVDDDFTGQVDVDVYNSANSTMFVWGYDAFASIQKAIDAVNPGGTVQVLEGTYHEAAHAWTDLDVYKSVDLIGAGSGATIVELNEYNVPVGTHMDGVSISASDVLIQGFKFTKLPAASFASGYCIRAGINVHTPPPGNTFSNITLRDIESEYSAAMNVIFQGAYTYSNVLLEDCNIHHGGERNFYVSPTTTMNGLTVLNSHFDNAGVVPGGYAMGFNLQGFTTDLVITGGTFNENRNGGLVLRSTVGAVITDVTVSHSGFETGTLSGIGIWEDVGTTSDIQFINPTVVDCGGRGIMFGTWDKTVSNVSVTGGSVSTVSSGTANLGVMIYAGGAAGVISGIAYDGLTVDNSTDHQLFVMSDAGAVVSDVIVANCSFTNPSRGDVYFYVNGGGTIVGDNRVTNCEITGTVAPYSGLTVNGAAVTVYENSFAGNDRAVNYVGAGTLNASGNWWGSDAPVWANVVAGSVDYTPWMALDGTYNTPGFTGDFSELWVDDDSPQTGGLFYIQEAVDMVSGSVVYLAPGTYVGQVVINGFADLDLIGSGAGVSIVQPEATTMAYNYTTPANNRAVIAIVNSDVVDVSDLTVDGLGKGNINYRFIGIAFFESGGSVTDCEVKDIRNTPIDGAQGGTGIYGYNFAEPARTVTVTGSHVIGFQKGGIVMNGDYLTASVVDNDVDGYGPASFIAMNGIQVGYNAVANVENNRVYGCSYTGPSWSSAGILVFGVPVSYEAVQVLGNEVDECQSGIYFVNIGGNIDNNTVTNTSAGTGTYYWGIIADPGDIKGRKPQPFEETVVASSSGSMAAGVNAIATSATGNTLDGDGDGVGIGAYCWSVANGGEGTLNFSAHENVITEFSVGMELYEDAGATLASTLTYNKIFYNGLGLYNWDGTVDAQFNSICYNTTNADDNTAGNYYNANCWDDWNGVQPYTVGGAGANVDNAATSGCGLDLTPDAIAYDCEGTFSVDVTIGESVKGMRLADVILMLPPSLTKVSLTTPHAGWSIFYSTPGGGQHNFTLQNASATLDGPAVLFTVTFSGSESCINSVVDMTYGKLFEDMGRTIQIPASLAPSVPLTTDCADPSGITVNSPAPGACYGPAPVLDISATDDCDLDGIYYQIDGCASTWLPIATGLTGTAYSNAAWEIPGYAGLSDGEHCVYFMVVDDFGRSNADACTFSWCFIRDLTGPEIVCPADFAVECEADIPACNPNDATATDACGGTVTITCSDGTFTGDPCGGTLTRTYTATDQFGNTSSCDQIITVLDTQAPVITCLPDISVQRLLDLPPCDEGDVTVTDNCGGAITVTCERSSLGGVGCSDVPALVYYTYTATDVCGNSATCQRVVTVLRPDCPFAVSAGDGSGVVNAFAGQTLTLPVNVDEISTEVSSFDLALRYDKNAVTVQSVDRGDALAAWEYFSYRLETSEVDGSGIVRLIGMADLNNGVNPPLSAYMPLGAIANVRLTVNADPSYIGRSISLEPCLNGCTDNTVVTRSGEKTIVMAESDVEGCASSLSGTVVTGVRFAGLRLDVAKPQSITGDINLNGMGYEVGDIVVLTNYLVNGLSALAEDASLRELQMAASDVNDDDVLMTVADLRFLLRVVAGEAAPIPGAKLSPYAHNAQAEYRIEDGRLMVSTNAAVDLGGALFIFRTEGLSVGSPTLSEAAAGMNVRVNSGNGECRVLVSTTLESMASVNAGRRELFSVPVTGDGTADLIEVQMSDADGALLLVAAYKSVLPTDYALEQNYPNPFNSGTVIPFALKDASEWTVTIYNVMGQVVRTFEGRNDAGRIMVTWDGADHDGAAVASGVYFYRVQTNNWHATKKMTLVK